MAIKAMWRDKEFGVGDMVSVELKLVEGGKERSQAFKGVVLSIKGHGDNRTFTVRKEGTGGIGVERIFPLISPWINDIKVEQKATHVRRAKLYYLRRARGKGALKKLYQSKEAEQAKKKAGIKKVKPVAKKRKVGMTEKKKGKKKSK